MRNRKFAAIMAGILAAVMLLGLIMSAIPVSAEKSSSQLKSEINELEKEKKEIDAQIEELEGQISENMGEMEKIVAEKNIIDQQVFLLHEQVNNINDQIAVYSDLIADKQAELDASLARQAELSAKNKERIRSMEEDGAVSYWSVLFEANSFSDLLDRLNMIEEIAASDQRRLEEMSQVAQQITQAKSELQTQKASLEESKEQLDVAQEELQVKREAADKLLAELVAKGAEFDALMEEAEKQASEMDAEIDALEGQLDEAKKREYEAWLATQKPVTQPTVGTAGTINNVDGIEWLIPISYTQFTSPYGWRVHPVYGDWRFHYGVDLSAPSGTPIVASRSGVVSRASYDGSSGYHVYINHQDGFTTRYLHMTHYVVAPGDYVYAGQVIGYCGSTGTSTGPHLHFSVYYNGQSVNPALFINI